MEVFILIIMGGLAIGLVIYGLAPKKKDEYEDAVRRRSAGLASHDDKSALQRKAKHRAANTMLEMAAPILSRPVMPKNLEEQTTLKIKLACAGFRRESATVLFLASKTFGGAACGAVGAILAMNAGKEWSGVLGYSVFGIGIGFLLPNFWLDLSIRRRSTAIRHGLPDSLDLMVVAVESGLGLDAAIQRVSDEMSNVHPDLAEEMQIATIQSQMGVPRIEALTRMAERTALPEMRALVAVIAQAEKLGTSVAKALRVQADTLRTKRRQAAEERAQKTAVKLLIPLILFIFPVIFVVLAGPAAIQLMKTFSGPIGGGQ